MAEEKWYTYPGEAIEGGDRTRATIHAESGLRFEPGVAVKMVVADAQSLVASGLIRECAVHEIATAEHFAEQRAKHGDDWQSRAAVQAERASEERGKTEAAPKALKPKADKPKPGDDPKGEN